MSTSNQMTQQRKASRGRAVAARGFYAAFVFLLLVSSFPVHAGILNEWGFRSDPAGQTLSQAMNTGSDEIDFVAGDEAELATDGVDHLVCTQDDPGTIGMWTHGAILDATLPASVSNGVQYMRCDFSYDLSDTNSLNDSGGVVGFAFYDDTGNQVAGVVLEKDVGAGASSPYQLTALTELPLVGAIAVITRVNLAAQTIDVWYDLTGDVSGFSEAVPATNAVISITSFDSLRFQSTGDIQPAGSSDEVTVDLLRTADSWDSIMEDGSEALERKHANEWMFERDTDGLSLNQALNTGTNSPLAQFEAGSASTVFITNSALLCIGEDVGIDGAVLDASLMSLTTGKHYLRYDVDYDFSFPDNDSGNVLGVYFTDSTGDQAAGLVLGYDTGDLQSLIPANRALIELTNDLALVGTLIAIAEVDLDNDTLKVWYDLAGANVFDENSPATTVSNMAMDSIDNLTFHATGDFRPAGSMDFAAIDNIRQASSWTEIVKPVVDLSAAAELTLEIDDLLDGAMEVGESNLYSVVIHNDGGPGENASSTLTVSGIEGGVSVVSNNIPASLGVGQSITNTYWLTARSNGTYTVSIQADADDFVLSAVSTLSLVVGSELEFLESVVSEVTGGIITGSYEPGETVDITVVSTNSGAKVISTAVNSLSGDLAYFSISNLTTSSYSSVAVGDVTSTVYRVQIAPSTPAGTYTFNVTNQNSSGSWGGSFDIDIFSGALLTVSPASVSLRAPEGGTDSAGVVVSNGGNQSCTFTLSDNAIWETAYTVEEGQGDLSGVSEPITLNGASTIISGISDVIDFDFDFPFFGQTYSGFYVTGDGVIGLSSTTNATDPGRTPAVMPSSSDLPLIAPFWGQLITPEGGVHYSADSERIVITWTGVDSRVPGGGTDLEFQAQLFANGQIDFRYGEINGEINDGPIPRVAIGIQENSSNYLSLDITPESDTGWSFISGEVEWVTYSPQTATLAPQQAVNIRFDLLSGQPVGTANDFTVDVICSGETNAIAVSAEVVAAVPVYSAEDTLAFSGPAGEISTASFVITNTGAAPLIFTMTDNGSEAAGYILTNATYNWVGDDGEAIHVEMLDPSPSPYISAADEGSSAMLPIGFAFPYFGASFTQFCVSVNGALCFDTTNRVLALWDLGYDVEGMPEQLIAPFWSELLMDSDASIQYKSSADQLVVTWKSLAEYGVGAGSNHTFQVVLSPDGGILFQYKELGGTRWPYAVAGLRDTANRVREVEIEQEGDRIVVTNINETLDVPVVETLYTNRIVGRAISVTPVQVRTIRYTPDSGTIVAGQTAEIILSGDASTLSSGSGTAVTSAVLTVTHNGASSPDALTVTFTATNSQQTVFATAPLSDTDNDGISNDDERTSGTDPLNANSVFTPNVKQTASGPRLSWSAPLDGISRTYTIYWTDDLVADWTHLVTLEGVTSWVDETHPAMDIIYYKMTVE